MAPVHRPGKLIPGPLPQAASLLRVDAGSALCPVAERDGLPICRRGPPLIEQRPGPICRRHAVLPVFWPVQTTNGSNVSHPSEACQRCSAACPCCPCPRASQLPVYRPRLWLRHLLLPGRVGPESAEWIPFPIPIPIPIPISLRGWRSS
ncbi:hypothetical protein SGPA1_40169 [Streptomyces misionensis JCM 4497]